MTQLFFHFISLIRGNSRLKFNIFYARHSSVSFDLKKKIIHLRFSHTYVSQCVSIIINIMNIHIYPIIYHML